MSSCCSTNETNPAVENGGRENLLGGGADDMTTCPVMVGTPVSKKTAEAAGLHRTHAVPGRCRAGPAHRSGPDLRTAGAGAC
ncbi:hypothetical protein ACFCVJ_11910, partial [Kocuria palustris]